jgi:hypothetical protein
MSGCNHRTADLHPELPKVSRDEILGPVDGLEVGRCFVTSCLPPSAQNGCKSSAPAAHAAFDPTPRFQQIVAARRFAALKKGQTLGASVIRRLGRAPATGRMTGNPSVIG